MQLLIPAWFLIVLAILIVWEYKRHKTVRTLYCMLLIVSFVVYCVIWPSALWSVPDSIFIFQILLFRGILAVAFGYRGWEELMGYVKPIKWSWRVEQNTTFVHFFIAAALVLACFQAISVASVGNKQNEHDLCLRCRGYFQGVGDFLILFYSIQHANLAEKLGKDKTTQDAEHKQKPAHSTGKLHPHRGD